MQYGLDVPTTGAYADARVLAQLAVEAEAAGWDGFFVWDVLGGHEPTPALDPIVALTAVALATRRLRIGTMVTPLARHRPWVVARQLANLDQLSGGRMTCTVGLGYSADEFSRWGEDADPGRRAARLDEGLAIMAGLWQQEGFSFQGAHYTVHDATLAPRPLQSPRLPLWVAGGWPRRAPFRRAARWDGVCFMSVHADTRRWLAVEEFRAGVAYVQEQRGTDAPLAIIMSGDSSGDRAAGVAKVQAFADAGATWWVEEGIGWELDEFRAHIQAGPPRP